MKITKSFHFHAAHILKNHPGKCKNLHGHTYKLDVCVNGNIDKQSGMVMDFSELKTIVDSIIIRMVDHKFIGNGMIIIDGKEINEIFDFVVTAENLAKHFYSLLKEYLYGSLYSITIWETETSKATYKGV